MIPYMVSLVHITTSSHYPILWSPSMTRSIAYYYISMQRPSTPAEDDEAAVPTEHVRNGSNLITNGTFTVRRKAAKRTLPCGLVAGGLNLLSPPQDEDIQARKKRLLEEPFSKTNAAINISSLDTAVSLPPPDAAAPDYANLDPVMDIHLNATATGAPRRFGRRRRYQADLCG
jgi:hypothetical protein